MTTRIDSHQHFWNPESREYPWMPEQLKQLFGPEDLSPLLERNGFQRCILVQTVGDVQETREFLDIAGEHDFVAGVVGWVDLLDPSTPQTLEELRRGPNGHYLVGIRHQVHDEEDPDWLLREPVQSNFDAIASHNLVYDLLVRTKELPSAITVARDFPHVQFVVDHIAKPPIASGETEPWASLMREFAGLPNVACKLSGMVTEADPENWSVTDLVPYVSTVVEIFGPERLMLGSDWPVCTLVASYDDVVTATRTALNQLGVLDDASSAAIFGGTAAHWYSLPR